MTHICDHVESTYERKLWIQAVSLCSWPRGQGPLRQGRVTYPYTHALLIKPLALIISQRLRPSFHVPCNSRPWLSLPESYDQPSPASLWLPEQFSLRQYAPNMAPGHSLSGHEQ